MPLQINSSLASILTALASSEGNTPAPSAGTLESAFKQVLTRFQAAFEESPRQRSWDSPALLASPALGGQEPSPVDKGEILAGLKAVRQPLEAALQDLQVEMGEIGQDLLEADAGFEQVEQLQLGDSGDLRKNLIRWRQRLGAILQSLQAEENQTQLPLEEENLSGEILKDLKTLRERVEAALSTQVSAEQGRSAAGEDKASAAFQLAEAVFPLGQLLRPDTEGPDGESARTEVALPPEYPSAGQAVDVAAPQVAAEKTIFPAAEAQLAPSLPDTGIDRAAQVAVTAMDQTLEPATLRMSEPQALPAPVEAPKPAEAEAFAPLSTMLKTVAVEGSSQPNLQAPSLKPSPKGDAMMGQPPVSLLAEIAGSLTPSSPQGGEKAVLALPTPFGHPAWADELGQRLVWMHGKSIRAAELHLNPPELGPVSVRIQVHDDQTSVQFASPHAAVRDAIEAALPRLKDLFEARQLPLTQVEVAQQSLPDRSHSHARREPFAFAQDYSANPEEKEELGQENRQPSMTIGRRLLSLYA